MIKIEWYKRDSDCQADMAFDGVAYCTNSNDSRALRGILMEAGFEVVTTTC
jgi:hypothetical protein